MKCDFKNKNSGHIVDIESFWLAWKAMRKDVVYGAIRHQNRSL
jgi:hypothetical protein